MPSPRPATRSMANKNRPDTVHHRPNHKLAERWTRQHRSLGGKGGIVAHTHPPDLNDAINAKPSQPSTLMPMRLGTVLYCTVEYSTSHNITLLYQSKGFVVRGPPQMCCVTCWLSWGYGRRGGIRGGAFYPMSLLYPYSTLLYLPSSRKAGQFAIECSTLFIYMPSQCNLLDLHRAWPAKLYGVVVDSVSEACGRTSIGCSQTTVPKASVNAD